MSKNIFKSESSRPDSTRNCWGRVCCLLVVVASGCSAFHPVRGVPASYLPDQYIGPSRDNKRTIDLSLLVRTPPDQYRVAAGDVLSIYVPRVLGAQSTEVATVGIEPPINMPLTSDDPPTIGYPIQIRDDNTISLPQLPPLKVGGLTLKEVEDAILRAYTVDHHILNPSEAMVLVSLQRPRVHRVLVVRQEATASFMTTSMPGTLNIGTSGKGTARTVTLKAYENDVLHALALVEGVDGLPGLNAENTIYIIRRRQHGSIMIPVIPGMQPGMPGQEVVPFQGVPGYCPPPTLPPVQSSTAPSSQAAPGAIQRVAGSSNARPSPYGGYRSDVEHASHSMGGSLAGKPLGGHSMALENSAAPRQTAPPETQMASASMPPTPAASAPAQLPSAPAHSMSTAPGPLPSGSGTTPALPDPHWAVMLQNFDPTIDNPNVVRIPIRLGPGEMPNITEDQITLQDGDIVFIESRETEVFYTGGLLGGGQYTLPRDYDLCALEAVSIAEGRTMGGSGLMRSVGGVSALNQDVAISASRLAIIRTLPSGQRITIEVDLHKAMRYPQENIRIQPGDVLLLEYTMPEAIVATAQRYLFEGALFGLAASVFTTGGK